jgi:hypothetical protein
MTIADHSRPYLTTADFPWRAIAYTRKRAHARKGLREKSFLVGCGRLWSGVVWLSHNIVAAAAYKSECGFE